MYKVNYIGKIVPDMPPGRTQCRNFKYSTLPQGQGVCSRNGGILNFARPKKKKEIDLPSTPRVTAPPAFNTFVSNEQTFPPITFREPQRGRFYTKAEMDEVYHFAYVVWQFMNNESRLPQPLKNLYDWVIQQQDKLKAKIGEKKFDEVFPKNSLAYNTKYPIYHPFGIWQEWTHINIYGAFGPYYRSSNNPDFKSKEGKKKIVIENWFNQQIKKLANEVVKTTELYFHPFFYESHNPNEKISFFWNYKPENYGYKDENFLYKILYHLDGLSWLRDVEFNSRFKSDRDSDNIKLSQVLKGEVSIEAAEAALNAEKKDQQQKTTQGKEEKIRWGKKILAWIDNYIFNGYSFHYPTFSRKFNEAFPELHLHKGEKYSKGPAKNIYIDPPFQNTSNVLGGYRFIFPIDPQFNEVQTIYRNLKADIACESDQLVTPSPGGCYSYDKYLSQLKAQGAFKPVGINYAIHMRL